MKKSPLIIFTGLAVAAVGGVLGLTSDRWMGEAPVTTAAQTSAGGETITKTDQPAASTTTTVEPTPEANATAAAEQVAAPVAEETPTTETGTGQTTAATTEETPAAATKTEETVEVASNTPTETPEAANETPTKPSFDTVRVEKTGEAVIAGTAEAGSEVVVMLDGETIGTATANADGAFVVIPEKALPQGSGALTIEAKGANETTAVKSDQSVAIIIPAAEEKKEALVAVISPDQPTKVLQKPLTDLGNTAVSLDAVDYDAAGDIVFNGRATPGTAVRLYVDNTVAGDAMADGEGRWTFTGASGMTSGNHMLRIDAIDAAGKVLGRVELPFVREDQTKVAAATSTESTGQASATSTEPAETATTTITTTTAAVETKPTHGRIVIQPGNNLWRISKVIYGDGKKYSMIWGANKDLIRDPDMIFPGQIFDTPNVVPPEKIDPALRDQMPVTP
jgi:nucleoid-associated protein YgaU